MFEESLRAVIMNWPLMRLAIDHSFGGPTTEEYVLNMVEDLLDFFGSEAETDEDIILDYLYDFVEKRLNCFAEDGSIEETCGVLFRLEAECGEGNFVFAQSCISMNPPKLQAQKVKRDETRAATARNADGDMADGSDAVSFDTKSKKAQMEVDADGWATVPVANKKAKKKKKGKKNGGDDMMMD
eukprot:TRINITY_DN3016_c0_g1_i1.p1 TRINITY_DN3016_c0_g1~~TRINITY_DN3016_c0_g1_i1.p1  ORF type:complete len:204 (-),score=87.92 TRINITY_DN3016_c0_g1_i1:87-638(-)